jgi:hypothetical protein
MPDNAIIARIALGEKRMLGALAAMERRLARLDDALARQAEVLTRLKLMAETARAERKRAKAGSPK